MATEPAGASNLGEGRPEASRHGRWQVLRANGASGARRYLTQEAVLLLFVLALAIAFGFNTSIFWSGTNLQNLSSQGAVLAMVAAGEIFPILIGGIDLSVGGLISMLSIFAVELSHHMPVWPAFGITILLGIGVGLVNGFLVTFARVSPIIATLGTWQIMVGFTLWYTSGLPVTNYSGSYSALGNNNLWFLPYAAWLALAVVIVVWVILTRTRFGRHVYALGGNFEAARLSGVRTTLVTIGAYAACSLFTAFGAITLSSQTSTGNPTLGGGFEIQAIAAVFIGGIAWGGGAGSVFGALLGVTLVTVLANGLDLAAVSSDLQTMITGLLVILAVAMNARRTKAGSA